MQSIDDILETALQRTAGPSIAVAAIRNGELVYARAIGSAEPKSIYNIASVTKQFVAACVLLLARERKLSLDDPVGKYFPHLTQADRITIRHLLSHTSGYPDYYPLGYADSEKLAPAAPRAIVDRYASLDLQAEPGAAWSYSNTGYHVAALIIERASGMPLAEMITSRLLRPAGMRAAFFNDPPCVTSAHAPGNTRFALGPLRAARGEEAGWMWASGGLAASVLDLAAWHLALMEHRILTEDELEIMTRPVTLRDGTPSATALGWFAEKRGPYAVVHHSGGLSGYSAQTIVSFKERTSVAVLANGDHVQSILIGNAIFEQLLPGARTPTALSDVQGKDPPRVISWLDAFTAGEVDRKALTPEADAFLTPERLADARTGLASLGARESVGLLTEGERGGMTWTKCRAFFAGGATDVLIRETAEGRLAEFNAYPVPV